MGCSALEYTAIVSVSSRFCFLIDFAWEKCYFQMHGFLLHPRISTVVIIFSWKLELFPVCIISFVIFHQKLP